MRSKSVFSICFTLFPILNIYAITGLPGLSIGQLLLVLLIGLRVLENGFVPLTYFKYFVVYSLIVTVWGISIRNYDTIDCMYEFFALLLFFMIFNYAIISADYVKVKKCIVYIGLFAMGFFIVQYVLSYVGYPISGIISFLPLSNEVDTAEFRSAQIGRDRLSSIFQEPAHYSEFMSIVLALILFERRKSKKSILLAAIISVTIILSMSTSGAVFLAIVWSAWGIFVTKESKKGKGFTAFLIVLAFISIPLILSGDYIDYISLRFKEISFEPEASEHGFSSYIRVLRGYIPFIESNDIDKLTGHGLGTLPSYIKQNPSTMFLSITEFNETWVNSFQYLLFMTGIIGTVLFGKQMMYFYKDTSFLGKLFILQYISAFLSSGILLTPTSALFLFFIEKEKGFSNKI